MLIAQMVAVAIRVLPFNRVMSAHLAAPFTVHSTIRPPPPAAPRVTVTRGYFPLLETHLARDSGKAAIFLQRIEPRIDFQRDQFKAAVLAGLIEPSKSDR